VIAMTTTIGAEFDSISEIYDSTRRAATEAELKAVSSELSECLQYLILVSGRADSQSLFPILDLKSWE
jgi:hypothetical protein